MPMAISRILAKSGPCRLLRLRLLEAVVLGFRLVVPALRFLAFCTARILSALLWELLDVLEAACLVFPLFLTSLIQSHPIIFLGPSPWNLPCYYMI